MATYRGILARLSDAEVALTESVKLQSHYAAGERVGRGLELNDCAVFLEGYAANGPPGWRQAAACFAQHIRKGSHRNEAALPPPVDAPRTEE